MGIFEIERKIKENLDLIAQKKFRPDLYYRLNVVNLHTPALRDRTEDIPLLINHFIEKYTKDNSKEIRGLTRDAIKILLKYNWPGNVRELENVIERAVVLSQGDTLDVEDFSEISEKMVTPEIRQEPISSDSSELVDVSSGTFSSSHLDTLDGRAMEAIVNEVEARMIQYAMKKFRYTKTRVAKFLGINRNTLDKKIKELNIEY
jgi:Nif-specific regulatory protein